MNFTTYLIESSKSGVVKETTIDEAITLIKKHCSQSIKSPIYRGIKNGALALIGDSTVSERRSKNTDNYYTIILDNIFQNTKYPLRSRSFICTTNIRKTYNYGSTYMVFPYDNTYIGVCPDNDIWDISIFHEDDHYSLSNLNHMYSNMDLSDDNYSAFIKSCVENFHENKKVREFFTGSQYWDDVDEDDADELHDMIASIIELMYDPDHLGFELADNKSIGSYKANEVWFSGKCIMIHEDQYNTIKDQLK